MCTRFYLARSSSGLFSIIDEANNTSLAEKMQFALAKPIIKEGEIRPTDIAAVIAPNKQGKRSVYPMIWGFYEESLKRPLVNCRMESAAKKTVWRDSWKHRRCVIPASYYFEWQHYTDSKGKSAVGDKYAIQPAGSDVTYLAGIYRIEKFRDLSCPVFAVVTRAPTEELAELHDRMPLILPENRIDEWIDPKGDPERVAAFAINDLIAEKV